MFERTRAPSCWGLSRGSARVVVVMVAVDEERDEGGGCSGAGWEMMPTPSLLAEPSQPKASRRRLFGGFSMDGDIVLFLLVC